MRILIIDDDELLCESLQSTLETEGYAVDVAHDGEKGSFLARTNEYALIILDNMMPKKTGTRVCQEIRSAEKHTPILMLSMQDTIPSKVANLDNGADDYLAKPFSYDELRARIKALMRRPREIEPTVLSIDNITLDIDKQRVYCEYKDVYLTKKEFSLLHYLMRNRGRVLSRSMIMEHVWHADADPFSNTIEAHILTLRKKLKENNRKNKLIHNIPGRGYVIDTDIS